MSASRAVKCTVCPWIDNRACGRGILIDPCPQCGSKVWYETLWYGDCDFVTGKMLWPQAEPVQPSEVVRPASEPRKQVVVNRSAIGPVQEKLRIQTPLRARTEGRKHQAPFTSVSFKRSRAGLMPERRSISVGEKAEILER
jgi:hypothetical protein